MRSYGKAAEDRPWSAADLVLLRELVPLLTELNARPSPERALALKPHVSALALDLQRSAAAIYAKAGELGLGL